MGSSREESFWSCVQWLWLRCYIHLEQHLESSFKAPWRKLLHQCCQAALPSSTTTKAIELLGPLCSISFHRFMRHQKASTTLCGVILLLDINPENHHRIYFQNMDGLRHDADRIDLYVSSVVAQFQVGTFCWADPGLAFSNMTLYRSLSTSLRSHFTTARCAFSSSTLPLAWH